MITQSVFVQTAAKEDLGLGLKAVWYGAEQFGNVVGLRNKKQRTEPQRQPTQVLDEVPLSAGLVKFGHRCCCVSCVLLSQMLLCLMRTSVAAKMTRQEVLDSIKRDYDETYFFTGIVTVIPSLSDKNHWKTIVDRKLMLSTCGYLDVCTLIMSPLLMIP